MNVEHQMLDPEIVTVISHCRLIDSQSEKRIYWRRNGQGLAAGHYVVKWPAGVTRPSFNEDAVFQGPFRSLVDAQSALDRASPRAGLGAMQVEASRAAAPARPRAES
jgi:hypothetical protein